MVKTKIKLSSCKNHVEHRLFPSGTIEENIALYVHWSDMVCETALPEELDKYNIYILEDL